MTQGQLDNTAVQCASLLANSTHKLVFAESCTSGLLAATISKVPGISQHFCGSFVTYRESLKIDSLGVDPETLAKFSAVSAQTSAEMLAGALQRCSESTIGLAITGHLGPNAPVELDGLVFIACGTSADSRVERVKLQSKGRQERQIEAAIAALERLNLTLDSTN